MADQPLVHPMVELKIERIQETVKIALGNHLNTIQDDLEKAIDHAVSVFDFQGIVTAIVREELKKVLKDTLPSIISAIIFTSGMQGKISAMVAKALTEIDLGEIVEDQLRGEE